MAEQKKVFSEQQVAAVVRRAAELQERAGSEAYAPGVTADELLRIGADLGIEGQYLQQAIDEANRPESQTAGFNLNEEYERVVDREIPPDDYDILLKYLRPTGTRSPITQVGRTLTGRTWTGCSLAHVDVTSKHGRTRVSVRSNSLFAFLVTLYPAFLGTIFLLGPLSEAGHTWLAIALAAVWLVIVGIVFNVLVKKGHKAARRLADRMAQSIAETETEGSVIPQSDSSKEESNVQSMRVNS